jgi:hypothetical protein
MQSSFVSRPTFFTDCSASHPIQSCAYERRYGGRGRSANLRALRLRGPVKAFFNENPFDELREFLCLSPTIEIRGHRFLFLSNAEFAGSGKRDFGRGKVAPIHLLSKRWRE